MSLNTKVLTSSSDLKSYEGRLRLVTKSLETLAKKYLPIKEVDIVFYDNPEGTIDEIGGIGGFTPCANTIFISLNPRHKHFDRALKKELTYVIAHELHHAIRFRTPIEKETLLEAVISEGLADHFALQVTGRKHPIQWCTALSEGQMKKLLSRAARGWNTVGYDHAAWFYGSSKKEIPRWTGYTLGYNLVATYLRLHPKASPAALVDSEAAIFIE
jgi:uncharacterized protein YjaZ